MSSEVAPPVPEKSPILHKSIENFLPPLPTESPILEQVHVKPPEKPSNQEILQWARIDEQVEEKDFYQEPLFLPQKPDEIDLSLHLSNLQRLNSLLNATDLLEPRGPVEQTIGVEDRLTTRKPILPPRIYKFIQSVDVVDEDEFTRFADQDYGLVTEEPLIIPLEMDDVVRGIRVPSPTTTLEQFLKYLLQLRSEDGKRMLQLTPVQKVRAVYIWVSENVRWEKMRTLSKLVLVQDEPVEELNKDSLQRANSVLHSRIARNSDDFVCLLFEFLKLLGFKPGANLFRVCGYWKNSMLDMVRHTTTPPTLQPNHSWIMIRICGEYRMLDPALASPSHPVNGFRQHLTDGIPQPMEQMESVAVKEDSSIGTQAIDGSKSALPSLKTTNGLPRRQPCDLFFFLLRPSRAIHTHFPTDEVMQFITPTINMEKFWSLPYLRPTYFEMCLEFMSKEKQIDITDDDQCQLQFRSVDPDVVVSAEFQLLSPEATNPTSKHLSLAKERVRLDSFRSITDDPLAKCVLVQSHFDERGCKIIDISLRLVGGLTGALPQQLGILKIFAGMRGDYDQVTLEKLPLACAFRVVHHSTHPVTFATLQKSPPPPYEFVKLFPLALPAGKDLYILEPLDHCLRVGHTHTFRVVPCWKDVKQYYQESGLPVGKSKLFEKDLMTTSMGTLPRYMIGASGDLNRQIYLVTPKKKKHLLIWNHQAGYYEVSFQVKNRGMHILVLKVAKSDLTGDEDDQDSSSGTDTDDENAASGIQSRGSTGSLLRHFTGGSTRKVAFAAYEAV